MNPGPAESTPGEGLPLAASGCRADTVAGSLPGPAPVDRLQLSLEGSESEIGPALSSLLQRQAGKVSGSRWRKRVLFKEPVGNQAQQLKQALVLPD